MQKELEHVTILSIWETSIPKIQNIITQKIYDAKHSEFDHDNNHEIAAIGIQSQYDQNQINQRISNTQQIANKDRHVSAWMHANPADQLYKMNNTAWNLAMQTRLNLNLIGNGNLYCRCGEKTDYLCVHQYTCRNRGITNLIRNNQHKKLKWIVQDLIRKLPTNTNTSIRMDNTLEPLLSEYFPVVNNNITTIQGNNTIIQGNTPIQLSNDDPTDKDKSRGDMLLHDIKNGKAFIVDFKLTEATAKYIRPHTRATQPAQQGEEIKINDYKKHFDITPTNNAEMIFFTLTTQGAPSKDAKKLIDMLFQDEPAESKNIKKQQFLERLSSGIQTMRSVNIQNVLQHYTTRERPPPSSSEIIQSSHSLRV
jgi:hypothetical protein